MSRKAGAKEDLTIRSKKEFEETVEKYHDLQDQIAEINIIMEEEYGLTKMMQEAAAIKAEITNYMDTTKTEEADFGSFRVRLVRKSAVRWDESKLKTILGPTLFAKACKLVVASENIEDLVRSGEVKQKMLDKALIVTPQASHIRVYESNSAEAQEAEKALEALS